SGTLVVLAPFVPLAFWPGVIGKFMYFLPITLIVTLIASLIVAYIINPVFAADFMKVHHKEDETAGKITRGFKVNAVIFGSLVLMCYITGLFVLGDFAVFLFDNYALQHFLLKDVITSFQTKFWPRVQNS